MNLNAGSFGFAPVGTALPTTTADVHVNGWETLGTVAVDEINLLPASLEESIRLASAPRELSFTFQVKSMNRDVLRVFFGDRLPRSARSLRRRKANLRRKRRMRRRHR
ncbi:hypothetical protein [Prescottella equi]|uniref:hypothetical protein n=1 Tax=Rhodococcus hoagii TaxID=43767 RepID=UPI001EEB8178|nr:hypothetical protein [Prescottella equi]